MAMVRQGSQSPTIEPVGRCLHYSVGPLGRLAVAQRQSRWWAGSGQSCEVARAIFRPHHVARRAFDASTLCSRRSLRHEMMVSFECPPRRRSMREQMGWLL